MYDRLLGVVRRFQVLKFFQRTARVALDKLTVCRTAENDQLKDVKRYMENARMLPTRNSLHLRRHIPWLPLIVPIHLNDLPIWRDDHRS
jgi:hypothetical protein